MGADEKVVILGASDRPDRYAYKAFKMLQEYGHQPIPVHPQLTSVEGVSVVSELKDISESFDTLTLYVNPKISEALSDQILQSGAKRVIFNPGTENQKLEEQLRANNIEVVEGCTLVMLRTGQF